ASLAPRVIAWESTRACNYACVHCRATAQKQADPNQLTTQEALHLMDEIAEICKPVLIISGGDPLQRTDIFTVASYADKLGFRVVMSPSGSDITPAVIAKMKDSGVKMISLSLDGSTAQVHDSFRQIPSAFDLILRNIALAKQGGMPFRINTTVTKHNVADLDAIHHLIVALGAVEWDVFMLVPTGRGKVTMEISPHDYEATLRQICELSQKSPIPIKMTCAPQYTRVAAQFGKAAGRSPHGKGCMAGNGFCFISHVGDIFGCGFLPVAAGNVRTEKFGEIYQKAPLFVMLRDNSLLIGKCGVCNFKVACGGCRARALSVNGSVVAEEPYCTYQPTNGR
ncbi:MAG TPA: radical SAM protein, partial [Candidatus Acidoferrales bacterium]|nr:radical SAM protein [Candidatus Acidoferrales bacterium]